MGIPYALIKREVPEAFELGGKGHPNILMGWPGVFGRRFGDILSQIIHGRRDPADNFQEPFRIDTITDLDQRIADNLTTDQASAKKAASLLRDWAGTSEVFLVNYWEEIESFQEEKDRAGADQDFSDLRSQLRL